MKVVMLGHTVPQSGKVGVSAGISRYIYYLSREIRNIGNDVELFVRDDFKPNENWIKTISAPKLGWFPYPLFAYMRMKKTNADVFHADYVHTGAALLWANKRPAVVTIHDILPFSYRKEDLSLMDIIRVKWYMKNFRTISNADAIILASEHAKKEALKKTNLPEDKLHAIHYGIDLKKFRPLKKTRNDDNIKIGYLGGLDARKNFGLLVECFKKISRQYDNVELHVGGTGRSFVRYKAMNIPRMFLHGPISFEDVPKFLNSLDIFVFPTLGEGFGLPVVEAMACGIPTVASNVTTMPEIVDGAGLLAAPNLEEMTEAIIKLIEDKELRRKLGKRGVERAQDFTWRSAAEKTVGVYESVMKA